MRSDMHEVVIERPRWGSARGYPRAWMRNRGGADAPPKIEAMGRYYREKSLSDNLAPLRRYLASNAGRPWSKVRSEMSAHLRLTSAVQKHIFDHLAAYVCATTFLRDGAVWGADSYGRPREVGGADFYVHPRTGVLTKTRRGPRKLQSRLRVPDPNVREVRGHFLRRIDGEWFAVELAPLSKVSGVTVWDAFARQRVSRYHRHPCARAEAQWQRGVYARSLRRLSKTERCQLLGT